MLSYVTTSARIQLVACFNLYRNNAHRLFGRGAVETRLGKALAFAYLALALGSCGGGAPHMTSSASSSASGSSSSSASSSSSSSSSSASSGASSSSSGKPVSGDSIPTGRYAIHSELNGLPLEITEYSQDNGATVRLWESLDLLNQKFDVVDLDNGYYAIRPAHSGKSLDVWDRSTDDGGEIRQYDYLGEPHQQWQINALGDGRYSLVSRMSGMALDVWNGQAEPGALIRQSARDDLTNQQWRFVAVAPPHDFTELVWSDEFDYEGLPDPAFWGYEQGLVRNNEAQYYTVARPENVKVADGMLTITARRENYQGAAYTSASLHTRDKLSWTYGRFEMRARIDVRDGMWPAFWMLGPGKWPEGGEIDIMEYYQGKILANVAWKADNADAWSAAWDSATFALSQLRFQHPDWEERFHVWRMDWSAEEIRLYVDDLLLNSTNLANLANPDGSNPFIGKPFYLMVNLAIGGNNGGDPSGTAFPAVYEVDYVRVYQ